MKKTLFFLLGALLVTMLPLSNANAQKSSAKDLTWVGYDTTVAYNGTAFTGIHATFIDDNNNIVNVNPAYYLQNGVQVSAAVNAGVYAAVANAPSGYTFNNPSCPFTIAQRTLHVDSINTIVESVKFFDGNDNAVVVSRGELVELASVDRNPLRVYLNVWARYHDATVGDHKSIVAYYSISGPGIDNYTLDDTAKLITTEGVILANFVFGGGSGSGTSTGLTSYNGIDVRTRGYCDNVTLNYNLSSGSGVIDEYKLIFPSEEVAAGFTTTAWKSLDTVNKTITFAIPANTRPKQNYTGKIIFRNSAFSAYPTLISDTITFKFNVNLSKTYVVAIFDSVVSINNAQDYVFEEVQWYRDGAKISGATGLYYYDPNGLKGHTYSADVRMPDDGTWVMTCEQDYTAGVVRPSDPSMVATVAVHPNPAIENATVRIENSASESHALRVMNIMGTTVYTATFEGEETVIDMRNFIHGTYTVTVDGITVRVIKK